MNDLFKQYHQAQKLNGKITTKEPIAGFINRADNYLCQWADNKDPEPAAKLILEITGWMIQCGYDPETIIKEVVFGEVDNILDGDFKK